MNQPAELREYPIETEFELIDAEGISERAASERGAIKGSVWTWGKESYASFGTLKLRNKEGQYNTFYPHRLVVLSKEPKTFSASDFEIGQTIRIKAGTWQYVTWPENATAKVVGIDQGTVEAISNCATSLHGYAFVAGKASLASNAWLVPFEAVESIISEPTEPVVEDCLTAQTEPTVKDSLPVQPEPAVKQTIYQLRKNGVPQYHATLDGALAVALAYVRESVTVAEWEGFVAETHRQATTACTILSGEQYGIAIQAKELLP